MVGMVDFGIVKPELAGAFGAGMQSSQDTRMRNEEAQIKLDQLKQDREMMVQFQQQLKSAGKDPDLNKLFDSMIATGNPDYAMKGIEGKRRLKAQDEFAKLQGFDTPAAPEVAAAAPMAPAAAPAQSMMRATPAPTNALGSGMFGMEPATNALAAQAAPAAVPTAPTNALAAQPNAGQAPQIQKRINDLMRFASANPEMATQAMQQARILQDQLELFSRRGQNEPADAIMMQRLGYPLTQAGYQAYRDAQRQERMLSPAEEQQRIRIAAASRAPAPPRAEQPLEKVVDPTTGKIVFASREEALRGRMTPAAAMESLPPKEIQKREAALPQATAAIKGFETKSDSFVADLQRLRDHPGLSQITGLVAGRVPAVTADGRAAQALYDKVVAKGGFQALQDMRDASKTGGALGNVSNQEGKQLTASFAAIQRTQDAKDVRAAIDDAVANIQGAKTRMREAYDSTYSYKTGNAPASGGVIDFGSLK